MSANFHHVLGRYLPTLDWIGKRAVVGHHLTLPYRLLRCDPELSCGDAGSGNLLVQGDNLEALRALLPHYGGLVKCAYNDPPYNTGHKLAEKGGWFYDDRVDSPEIRNWLNKVVGEEGEDLSRHDKWICMMYPRLKLIHDLLRDDGVIFVSIDDNEYRHLHLLLDEIFGGNNHLGTIIWNNATDNNPTRIAVEHEYIVCFAKNATALERRWTAGEVAVRRLIMDKAAELAQAYNDETALRSAYKTWFDLHKDQLAPFQEYTRIESGGNVFTASRSVHNPGKEGYRYDILHPATGRPCTEPLMGYRFPEDTARDIEARDGFIFGPDETNIVRLKLNLADWKGKLSSVYELDGRRGANELQAIFGKKVFNNPKPVDLIADLIQFSTGPDDIVLDSFGGSGTTGHAVLQLNGSGESNRRFVLVEREESTAVDVTAHRLRAVIQGAQRHGRGGRVFAGQPGLGGGFRFCRLGPALFASDGSINPDVSFHDLAAHVFFSETGTPLPGQADGSTPFLGIHGQRAVFLLRRGLQVNGSLSDGILTPSALSALQIPEGHSARERVIYADGCLLTPDRLKRGGATFRQVPYQISGY